MKKFILYFRILALILLFSVATIGNAQGPCAANFSYTLNPAGNVTFSVTFNNSSMGTTYYWDCNQTQFYSYSANPSAFFPTNGAYVINLTAMNSAQTCSSTVTQTIIVSTAPCLVNANFGFIQGTNGAVTFYNYSTGIAQGTTYLWDFGDNSSTSTAAAPVHTFPGYGSYVVTLTANNNYIPSCTSTKTMLVNYNLCSGGVNISYTISPGGNVILSASAPQAGPQTIYTWFFGNNTTFSAVGTPTASTSYSVNGAYSPGVLMSSPTCSASGTASVNITNTATACNLVAGFVFNQSAGNGNVTFNNATTGAVTGCTYSWNFGDNTTSGLFSPVHSYAAYGSYLVTLTANNNFSPPTCISTTTMMVNYNTCNGSVNNIIFSINPNGNVTFTGNSSLAGPSTQYLWSFGNSTSYSTAGVPTASVNYSFNGGYYIGLLLSTPNCSAFTTQSVTVTNTSVPCYLSTNFYYYSNSANGSFSFYTNNIGTVTGTSFQWNFGDNSTSTLMSPSHTYSANGTYTVTLIANNNFTTACIYTQTAAIVVDSYCNLVPGFSVIQGTNGAVSFSNTSTGTWTNSIYSWDFGDGIGGGGSSPSHNYANGSYTVVLTVINPPFSPNCYGTYSTVITVTSNCIANAGFSISPSGTPLFWNAFPASPGNVTAAVWSWGDGSTSNTLFTSHTYSTAGTYSICLSVTVSCGASDTICNNYAIFKSADTTLDMVYINVIDPATVGIKNHENKTFDCSVSPNPNNGSFNLKMNGLNGNIVDLNVYDITGKIIYHENVQTVNDNLTKEIQLDQMPDGIYFLKANSGNKIFTKKIVINQ